MKKTFLNLLFLLLIASSAFAVIDTTLTTVANAYLRTIFDNYTGANAVVDIAELVSDDYYPLRRSFIDEFKFSRRKIKSCRFEYKINDIKSDYLKFHVDINWQKKVRKEKKSIIETTKGRTILIFDKTGKLLKLKGDNPFR